VRRLTYTTVDNDLAVAGESRKARIGPDDVDDGHGTVVSPAARTDAQHGEVACPGERADRGQRRAHRSGGSSSDLSGHAGGLGIISPSDMTASAADVTRVYRELFGEQSLQADVVR